jgi:hypothetical protein
LKKMSVGVKAAWIGGGLTAAGAIIAALITVTGAGDANSSSASRPTPTAIETFDLPTASPSDTPSATPTHTPSATATPIVSSPEPENGGFLIRNPGVRVFLLQCTVSRPGLWLEMRESVGATQVVFDGWGLSARLNSTPNEWFDGGGPKVEVGIIDRVPPVDVDIAVRLLDDAGESVFPPFVVRVDVDNAMTLRLADGRETATSLCTG